MKIREITNFLESWAPRNYQEDYDNAQLIIGSKNAEITNVLVTLDVTEDVLDEALTKDCNLIIAHHPLIFKGLKKINDQHWVEKCVIKAIKNDLAIYAIHTNLDHVVTGVNKKIADKIGLIECEILQKKPNVLQKITVFVPKNNAQQVAEAMHQAGAGNIGNYNECSFQSDGTGFFKPNEYANPAIGKSNVLESVEEAKIEVIVPTPNIGKVIAAMKKAHPYEEVAYYQQELLNKNQEIGSGMIGKLPSPIPAKDFLDHLKEKMDLNIIKHTKLVKKNIQKVALCGGAGYFLLNAAKSQEADIFISSDFKYHDFFEANNEIIIADIGHYESEKFTKDLIVDKLKEKFSKFAVRLSITNTNPVKYK